MPTIVAPTTIDNRSAAVSLAEQGITILPCVPGGKAPLGRLVRHGYKDASSDPRVVYGWLTQEPTANIAMVTGQINRRAVLDADWRNGADDDDLPPTWNKTAVVSTPGGLHAHYSIAGPQKTIPELDGIGVKADGGYVIMPPSTRPEGAYEWFKTLQPLEFPAGYLDRFRPEQVLAKLPAQLQDQVLHQRESGLIEVRYPRKWADKALSNQVGYVMRATKNRNNQLNTSAFILAQIVAIGWLREQTVNGVLTNAGLAVGLGAAEIRATIASGMSRGRLFPRQIILVSARSSRSGRRQEF